MQATYKEDKPASHSKYIILQAETSKDMCEMVNNNMDHGYIVIGPAQLTIYDETVTWTQTMVHKSASAQVYA